jgi:phage terminase large subunit GpA-like protein
LNTLGYFIDVDPGPILLVYPTVTMAQKVSRQRVAPLIRNCESLRNKIRKPATWRYDGGSDSLLMKTFRGGMLVLGGAERPQSLSQFPMRIVLLDEIDRYKSDVGEEGDPTQLAITRTVNFWNRKIVLSSTPTIKNASRIELAYGNSSQGRWCLPCPSCKEFQELRWNQIDYSTTKGKVLCRCTYCQNLFTKVKWLSGSGKWIHRYPDRRVKGYFLNALPSPWVPWELLVSEWLEANKAKRMGNTALLKVFINTKLAETYEDYAFRIESHALYDRREVFRSEVPEGVYVLTVGCDIQDVQKRINYEVVGWGKNYESWGIEYGTILADPREKEWHDLFDSLVFNRVWKFANGRGIQVRKGLIDANGAIGPYVYYYTKRRQPRIFSCKGSSHETFIQSTFTGGHRLDLKYNSTWYPIFTLVGKDELMQRLFVSEAGSGFCHFPCGEDEEDVRGYTNDYFIGLTSEQKHETVNNLGYTVFKYKKEGASRTSGEPLDCRIYARAALELFEQTRTIARMEEPDYVKNPSRSASNHPFFDAKLIKAAQKQQKVTESFTFFEEMNEMGRKVIESPKKQAALRKFGQFGSSLRNFNPFKDE